MGAGRDDEVAWVEAGVSFGKKICEAVDNCWVGTAYVTGAAVTEHPARSKHARTMRQRI